MAEKINMVDFLHKNSWFFGSGTAELNVLVFGYYILPTLFNYKIFKIVKFVASRESSK
jgi:hypothetical protein